MATKAAKRAHSAGQLLMLLGVLAIVLGFFGMDFLIGPGWLVVLVGVVVYIGSRIAGAR